MRKLCFVLALCLLLAGCAEPEAFETMLDSVPQVTPVQPRQIRLELPEEAAVTTLEDGTAGTLYLCGDYCAAVQTLSAGDLDATLRTVTGYGRKQLTVMRWQSGELARYECAWASTGENGDTVGRTAVLDDGIYHYSLTLTASADKASELRETWSAIFSSFALEEAPQTQ